MLKTELEQNIDFLLSAALHKCGNLEDAQDLAQETLLSALTFLSKGGVIEDMKAWLLTVLNRRFYDMLRRKYNKPTVSCDTVFDIPDDDDALENIIKSEEAEKIRREIAYLSKLYREVIIRRYMKNQSVEQIARELNIPVGTVKSRLSGGREQIKKGFKAMENYTKQSYEPEHLHVACSGRSGLNGEPYSIVNSDLILQNILIAAYNEPITISDLSRAIGIPAAYIEPLVQKLIDNELMAQIGGKVFTYFIIFTNDDVNRFIPAQKELVSTHFQKL
jgi:RNA polymerase sigma factor (sigma-70 family)